MMRALSRSSLLFVLSLACACGGSQKRKTVLEGKDPYSFHRSIGVTLLRTDQPKRALPHLERLVSMRSDEPEPYFLLARAHMQMRLWEPAERLLTKAVELDEKYAPAHAMLGVLLDATTRHALAEKAHRHAIELRPGHSGYHNNLGFNLYLQERFSESLDAYKDALALDAGQRRVHNNVGFVYGMLRRDREALSHFRLAGAPAEAKNNLGLVYEERGQLDLAYDQYLEALSDDPELARARANLKRVSRALGRPVPASADEGENP